MKLVTSRLSITRPDTRVVPGVAQAFTEQVAVGAGRPFGGAQVDQQRAGHQRQVGQAIE